jgi:hypothetical protein
MASEAAGKEVSAWLQKQGQQQQQQSSNVIGIENHDPDSRSVVFTVDNTTFSVVYPDSYPNSTEEYLVSVTCSCHKPETCSRTQLIPFLPTFCDKLPLTELLTHSLLFEKQFIETSSTVQTIKTVVGDVREYIYQQDPSLTISAVLDRVAQRLAKKAAAKVNTAHVYLFTFSIAAVHASAPITGPRSSAAHLLSWCMTAVVLCTRVQANAAAAAAAMDVDGGSDVGNEAANDSQDENEDDATADDDMDQDNDGNDSDDYIYEVLYTHTYTADSSYRCIPSYLCVGLGRACQAECMHQLAAVVLSS